MYKRIADFRIGTIPWLAREFFRSGRGECRIWSNGWLVFNVCDFSVADIVLIEKELLLLRNATYDFLFADSIVKN